jgi:hypothetical protein
LKHTISLKHWAHHLDTWHNARRKAGSCLAAFVAEEGIRPGANGGGAGRVLRVLGVEQVRQHGHAAAAWGSSQSVDDSHQLKEASSDWWAAFT